jgi:NAD(P)-dependent dehydrogenase (short-subunit alcohol dehydrogenase family)
MKAPVVVLDAANPVGRAVVDRALAEARPVIAVTAEARTLARLRARRPDLERRGIDLTVVEGSIADEAAAASLADALRELDRPLAGVVLATCADPRRGRVLDQPVRELQRNLEADLQPQLAAARHLLPVLAEHGRGGGYVVIGTAGTDHPWAGYGYRSIAAAAVAMLVRVLHNEARPLGVRVQMLAVSRPVRTDDNVEDACDGWPAADRLADQALALVDQVESRHPVNALVRFAEAL